MLAVAATAATHYLACRRPALTPSTSGWLSEDQSRLLDRLLHASGSAVDPGPGPSAGLGHETSGRKAVCPRHVSKPISTNPSLLAPPNTTHTQTRASLKIEREVRRRNMRECEEAMMEDTVSRRGYATTAAWDKGNMIRAISPMKNPTISWRFGDG